jgi:hypothetical protein
VGEAGIALKRSAATREAGAYLCAWALGYISHAAIDTALHPLVNLLAARRASALRDTLSRQHGEVEKFQSILFHEQRNGFDFMGSDAIAEYIRADHSPILSPGAIKDTLRQVLVQVLGEEPAEADFRRWTRGYSQYVYVLSSWLGKRVAPPADKERERASLYDAVDFPGRFHASLARSRLWVETLAGYLSDGSFDRSARTALRAVIPEQTLDPGPEQD